MSSYYLSRALSDYVEEMGGRDWLAKLVESAQHDASPAAEEEAKRATPTPVEDAKPATPRPPDLRYCAACGKLLQHPGADICFACGARQPAH